MKRYLFGFLLAAAAYGQMPAIGGAGGGGTISGTGCIPSAAPAGRIVVTGSTTGTCDPSAIPISGSTITASLTGAASLNLLASSNLSDLASAATARTNLGLGTIATKAATTGSAPQKADGSGGLTPALAADIVGLFSTCSGTQYLGADGACHNSGGGGSGCVPSGTVSQILVDSGSGTCTSRSATLDSSGNFSTPGSLSTGVGGSVGGYTAFGQGTATTAPTSSVGFMAPTSVTTKFMMTLPAAPATGFLLNTGTTDPSTLSFVASSGSGSVCLTTSCVMTTPNLGTPSAATLTNATGLPVSTGISGLGTGVATALGTAVSGSGAICLATGSACAGGVTPSTRNIWASRPSCNGTITGQIFYATDGAGLYSQCDGSSWANFYQNSPVTIPPAAASFTTVNGGTLSDNHGSLKFTKSTTGLGVNLIALTNSGADFDIRVGFTAYQYGNYPECGLWWATGTVAGTSNATGFQVATSIEGTGGLQFNLIGRSYFPINGSIASVGPSVTAIARHLTGGITRIRVTKVGSTFTYYLGDGDDWELVGTNSDGNTYSHVGFGCDPRGTDLTTIRVFDFSGYSN